MKITLLDAGTLGNDMNFDLFSKFGETVVFENTSDYEVISHIDDSDVIIVNKIKLNKNNLSNAKNLKLICVAATGFDNIDLSYCKSHDIGVCNVTGYSTHSVAQVTLAMALSLSTHLNEYNTFVNNNEYSIGGIANRLTPVYHELLGKTWGIIGLGNIGKQVARVAESLGCHVIGYKRTPDNEYSCHDISYICQNSDIISVHLPLNDETKGIISSNLIASMKKNVIFINVARGSVTDEAALAKAILENKIGALGVDVYSKEPFGSDHPFTSLLGLPNVCMTPHMAWGAFESRQRCLNEILLNIEAFFDGKIRNRLI